MAPVASAKILDEVDPLAVVMVKLESVAVSESVKAMSLLLVVAMVLPPLYAPCKEIASEAHLVT